MERGGGEEREGVGEEEEGRGEVDEIIPFGSECQVVSKTIYYNKGMLL